MTTINICFFDDRASHTAVPRRPRGKPPAAPVPAVRARRPRGRDADRRRAARRRGRRDRRRRADAGVGGPACRDRRRVPARLVDDGLRLRARRRATDGHHRAPAPAGGRLDLSPRTGASLMRVDGPIALEHVIFGDDLRDAAVARHDGDPEGHHPVAVDDPLPQRARRDRPRRLPGSRRVLGRPRGRLSRRARGPGRASGAPTSSSTTSASRTSTTRPSASASRASAATPTTSTRRTSRR